MTTPAPQNDKPLLAVDDLHVEFDTYGGIVKAVRVSASMSTQAGRWRLSANRDAESPSRSRASWTDAHTSRSYHRGTALLNGIDILSRE
jgi:hypothetical protein